MRCPSCDTDLVKGARFCGVCGHQLKAQGALGKTIVKAPPGAPTLSPGPATASAAKAKVAAAEAGQKPRGKQAGMPKHTPAPQLKDKPPAHSALPYLEGDPYLGTVLNKRFEVLEKLGEGGFGAVYKGKQTGTGREVALKLLHPEMTRDDKVLARFRREGEVLCQLRDAHTITTYDFDQTENGTLFIAMELLGGRSLHDVFQSEAPLVWHRMLRLVSQMCSSLNEAHSLGIVHRDLKPENIYLESRPGHREYVKILDFGIAKVVRGDGSGDSSKQLAQLTATGQTLGTLEYMSPEQLMGKQLDGRSDVYAVGVLCYEMMTGQLPFPDAVGPAAQIAAQLKKTPPMPSSVRPEQEIPDEVDEIVLKCLGKRPDDRYASIGELKVVCDDLLERYDRGELGGSTTPPTENTPAPVETKAPQPPRAASEASERTKPTPAPGGSRVGLLLIGLLVAAAAGIGVYFALEYL